MFLTGQTEIEKAVAKLNEGIASLPPDSCMDLLVLPIYAALPPELQVRTRTNSCALGVPFSTVAIQASCACLARLVVCAGTARLIGLPSLHVGPPTSQQLQVPWTDC